MSAGKIFWGQVLLVLGLAIAGFWAATEWTAWRLAWQAQLGPPWLSVGGWRVYPPWAFFGWWLVYDAYAPRIFVKGALIAVAGGGLAMVVSIAVSVWRAREARSATTYGSARWAHPGEVARAGLLGPDGVVLGRLGP